MTETQAEYIPADKDLEKFTERSVPEVPAVIEPNEFITVIERLSRMENIPVDKIDQLFKMKQAEDDRTAKQEFNAAFARAQAKIELVVADQRNDQTKSNYANLKAILVKSQPIYTAEGFSLMFYEGDSPKETQKRVCVDIMHSAGHTEKRHGDFTIQTTGIAGKAMMTQIHGEGSAFSYGRRYLTCMIWNIPTGDDDDGNAAGGTTDYITLDQQTEISDAIKETGYDEKTFLDWMGVKSLETMPAKQYKQATQGLKEIREEYEKKGQGMHYNEGYPSDIISLTPQGTNSTMFTACCNTAICDDQSNCPKCKRLVVGHDAGSPHERGRVRWNNATRHWKRTE